MTRYYVTRTALRLPRRSNCGTPISSSLVTPNLSRVQHFRLRAEVNYVGTIVLRTSYPNLRARLTGERAFNQEQ